MNAGFHERGVAGRMCCEDGVNLTGEELDVDHGCVRVNEDMVGNGMEIDLSNARDLEEFPF